MAKEPEERYASCSELVGAAREALGTAGQGGYEQGVEEPRRKRRRALVVVVLALVAVAVAIAVVRVSGDDGATSEAAVVDAVAVDDTSVISAVAGTGESALGSTRDGGPASEATFGNLGGIALAADGSIYVSDINRVRRIGEDGTITTITGTGRPGFSGDGGPAVEATLQTQFVHWIAIEPSGSLLIADQNSHRVRRVDADGIITTIAGTGQVANSGDGGPASEAALSSPLGLALAEDGSIFVSTRAAIRKIDPDGIITTIAGTGVPGYSGDRGPATEAQVEDAAGLAFDADGNLYIADATNDRIRKVSPSGFISTMVGSGRPGDEGDGGPATLAELRFPVGIEVDADGAIYIADTGNNRVRKVTFDR